MIDLALRPDLTRCALEDRILPAIEFGMFPNPFLQVNCATNQLYRPRHQHEQCRYQCGW